MYDSLDALHAGYAEYFDYKLCSGDLESMNPKRILEVGYARSFWDIISEEMTCYYVEDPGAVHGAW